MESQSYGASPAIWDHLLYNNIIISDVSLAVSFLFFFYHKYLRFHAVYIIYVINVQIKIKSVKNVKNVEKKFKKTFDKNVADICHESNYYLLR